jgi:hypothetical protein
MKVRRGAWSLVLLMLAVVLASTVSGCSLIGGLKGGAAAPDLIGTVKHTPVGDLKAVNAPWGASAPNRILIVVSPEAPADVPSKVAAALGGKVVGEIGYVDLYSIGIAPTDAAGLDEAVAKAEAVEGVKAAMPDLMAVADVEVEGVACSVIKDDPAYAGENSRPYDMIGVENAWAVVRASGLTINPVTVGVADTEFFVGQKEMQGDPTLVMTDPLNDATTEATIEGGKVADYGSHGVGVAGIIGARADNGGQVGITSVLGDKRKTLYTRVLGGKYGGSSNVATDASDPTQAVRAGGVYQEGALVALLDQVKKGATAINISWGNSPPENNAYNRMMAGIYKSFFEKMSKDYPKVVFVCSAGNSGVENDASRFPSGANLPNVITVGNLNNDGSKYSKSNYGGPDSEVSIAAPGDRVVGGVGADGTVSNKGGGTSFATPQVTSAIAILQSLNPALTAAEAKQLLLDTKTTEFTDAKTGVVTRVPEGVGGGCVAVDRAVLRVVNKMRTKAGLYVLTMDNILALNRVDLVAEGEGGGPWALTAGAKGPGTATNLAITLKDTGTISGTTPQPVKEGGTATWDVTVPDKSITTAHVKRADTGACSRVEIGQPPLVGAWSWNTYYPRQKRSAKTGVDLRNWEWLPWTAVTRHEFYEKDGVLYVNNGWPKQAQVTVEGANVSFTVFTQYKGSSDWKRETYKGVLAGGTIKGTIYCEQWMKFPSLGAGWKTAIPPKPYTGKWNATKVP